MKDEAADIDDQADPNEVPDYAFIAFEYFRAREGAQPVEPYLHKRKEINDRMRQVLVDWLVEVCSILIFSNLIIFCPDSRELSTGP